MEDKIVTTRTTLALGILGVARDEVKVRNLDEREQKVLNMAGHANCFVLLKRVKLTVQ